MEAGEVEKGMVVIIVHKLNLRILRLCLACRYLVQTTAEAAEYGSVADYGNIIFSGGAARMFKPLIYMIFAFYI